MKFEIRDWAGNLINTGKDENSFDTYDDGWDWILGYCDEAMENGCDSFVTSLQGGQLLEKHEVLSSILDTLESLEDEENETNS